MSPLFLNIKIGAYPNKIKILFSFQKEIMQNQNFKISEAEQKIEIWEESKELILMFNKLYKKYKTCVDKINEEKE